MHLGQVILQGIVREPIHQFCADMGQKGLRIVQVRALIHTFNESESAFREIAANLACLFNTLSYHYNNTGIRIWTSRSSFLQ